MPGRRARVRLLRYIDTDQTHKLRALLRRHPGLVDEHGAGSTSRSPGRSPLIAACAKGNARAVRALLRAGADPARPDPNGDTPLHTAAWHAAAGGEKVFRRLVIPLLKCSSVTMDVKDKKGLTPRDILSDFLPKMMAEKQNDLEEAWHQKLAAEFEDEVLEHGGKYDDDTYDLEPETYDKWVDRIRRQRAATTVKVSHAAQKAAERAVEREREAQQHAEHLRRLQAEDAKRVAQVAEARLAHRRTTYLERRAAVTNGTSSLRFSDIPWPAPGKNAAEMATVLLHGAGPPGSDTYRRQLRKEQALWHPDGFQRSLGRPLVEAERQQIMATVLALSQVLNSLSTEVK
uniref:NF-kappa-B inhibitor-like protein 1 n=1 Tax=Myxine glutinosa TaxID=7769 RepID=UPI00358E100C